MRSRPAAGAPLRRSQRCAARNREASVGKDAVAGSSSQDAWTTQQPGTATSVAAAATDAAPPPACLQREDKVSVAVRSGLMPQLSHVEPSSLDTEVPLTSSALSGYWSVLPDELLENILNLCSNSQLGMLETTCSFFRRSGTVERLAKARLKGVPRARGLKANRKEGERTLTLLHFVNSQSAAAAQATAVACGSHHTLALLIRADVADGPSSSRDCKHSLCAFGRGFHGQLGFNAHDSCNVPKTASLGFRVCSDNPDQEEETMPAVVACGSSHSASISRRGELFTWGMGVNGELGLGQWTPLEVPRPRQCYASTRIVSISAGAHHTLAIAENGSLWSCGRGRQGQLGQNALQDIMRLTRIGGVLEGIRIVSASAGVTHSMALGADGSLYTWGDGRYGQLGHVEVQAMAAVDPQHGVVVSTPQKIRTLDPQPLPPQDRVTAIAAGGYHSMALTVGGTLQAFGRNDHGQLGTGDLVHRWAPCQIELQGSEPYDGRGKRAIQVACGAAHTVALIMNHGTLEVRTTGSNTWGQLGLGDRKDRCHFTPTVTQMPGMVAVQCGDEHSAAISGTGHLYVWGRGDSGQLGLGDLKCRWKPTVLKSYRVVHPEKTLRRNKRSLPVTRPVEPEVKRQRIADAWHYA